MALIKDFSKDGQRTPARIKVVGVGGGGCNAIRRMMASRQIPGVEFIAVNTDIKSLDSVDSAICVQIGENLTHGWGTGGNVKVGGRAAEEGQMVLRKAVKDAELVFITAGMGGGTGTGAGPVVAEIAKDAGALTIGVVTTPFAFEGDRRLDLAIAGIKRLREYVDNIIVVHNDRLLQFVEHDASMESAFKIADDVVTQGILSVSEVVNVAGEVNVDFADVKAILNIPGTALLAIGKGEGPQGAVEAAQIAIENPLLNINMRGSKGVLFCVSGGAGLSLGAVNAAGELIASQAARDAIIFFGMVNDEALGDVTKLTLVATGIKSANGYGTFFLSRALGRITPSVHLEVGRPAIFKKTALKR